MKRGELLTIQLCEELVPQGIKKSDQKSRFKKIAFYR